MSIEGILQFVNTIFMASSEFVKSDKNFGSILFITDNKKREGLHFAHLDFPFWVCYDKNKCYIDKGRRRDGT